MDILSLVQTWYDRLCTVYCSRGGLTPLALIVSTGLSRAI